MLGERLSRLRKEMKKTQEDISKIIGITRPAYTAYERGTRNPDFDTLLKLADYFDVSVDYLLGQTDNPEGLMNQNDNPNIEGFFGFDLGSLSQDEIAELQKKLKSEVEFYLWQKKQKSEEEKQ